MPAPNASTGDSARALLLTLLGEFVLPNDSAAWTSTIVEALGLLDVAERNARQAIARLADRDVIASERAGRRVRWHLTATGHTLLDTGAQRIYGFGADGQAWDGRWLVVYASVPEEQRAKRHQLRSQLEFAGFGFLGPGVAVSPHVDREVTANAILEGLDLGDRAVVLRAETGSFVPDTEIIRRAWDLDTLAGRYDQFVREFVHRQPRTNEARFVALAQLVHAWRRFPFEDPEIPDSLLSPGWPGRRAKLLFDDRRAMWRAQAMSWFKDRDASSTPS